MGFRDEGLGFRVEGSGLGFGYHGLWGSFVLSISAV